MNLTKVPIKLSTALLCVISLTACNADHLYETLPQQTVKVIENPFVVNSEKAIEEASDFLKNRLDVSGNTGLRSIQIDEKNATVHKTGYKVQLSEHQKSNQRVEQEVPVYTIKYKDKNGKPTGTVITVGDERFDRKIIAFNEDGEMDIAATKEAADFFGDMIAGYIHRIINTTTRNPEMQVRSTPPTPEEYTPNIPWGMYAYEIPLYTRWHHQGLPSTKYTPNNYSAGCNAVAIGQIMVYHQWPLKGRYRRYGRTPQTTSYPAHIWPLLNTPMAATAYQDYISDLLAEIGYKMNSTYTAEGTIAFPTNACRVFRQMGYNCNESTDYDANIIADEIKHRRPVFMFGKRTGSKSGGHSYIITKVGMAADRNDQELNEVSMIYINNGIGDTPYKEDYGADGWYFADIFEYNSVPNEEKYSDDDLTSTGMYNTFYPYRYACDIITGIKPDPNNPGNDQNL